MNLICASFGHKWDGCRCTVCGERSENYSDHTWVKNGCEIRCSVCGTAREGHDYKLVSETVLRTGTCPKTNSSDDYVCRYCSTPDACLNYPLEKRTEYRCRDCGKIMIR